MQFGTSKQRYVFWVYTVKDKQIIRVTLEFEWGFVIYKSVFTHCLILYHDPVRAGITIVVIANLGDNSTILRVLPVVAHLAA